MSVTSPAGFVAAGLHCGIKPSGRPDLSFVGTADGRPVNVAATFTQNKMAAQPVQVSQAHLRASGNRAAAVILNSGNANAANGAVGMDHAERMCAATASAFGCRPDEVLVCSTGLIGIPFPIDVVEAGIPKVVAARRADGGTEAAEAIMTTDTVRKEIHIAQPRFSVGGMAKGAAMLAPNMATMLAVLTTDAAVEPDVLQQILRAGVERSFNRMTVDGCTSTNDTVILMASGAAGPVDHGDLAKVVEVACFSLANQMVGDAEGATKVVTVSVTGAVSDADALAGARKVADSQLCKCSWYGCDPYWGRIASELGSAGIAFEQGKVSVAYGDILVAQGGVEVAHDAAALKEYMAGREIIINAHLGLGGGGAWLLTNDLTHAYIDENMGTS